jgi:hypothetical protein
MRTIELLGMLLPFVTLLSCGPGKPVPLFDIAVLGASITPAPAGQPSDALVTVANRGTHTLLPEDYLIEISAPGSAEEMRANACGPKKTHVFVDVPEEIEPGQTKVVTVHHIFARAGRYPMTVRATLGVPEDGATRDNAVTITRNVPESACCRGKYASR